MVDIGPQQIKEESKCQDVMPVLPYYLFLESKEKSWSIETFTYDLCEIWHTDVIGSGMLLNDSEEEHYPL